MQQVEYEDNTFTHAEYQSFTHCCFSDLLFVCLNIFILNQIKSHTIPIPSEVSPEEEKANNKPYCTELT